MTSDGHHNHVLLYYRLLYAALLALLLAVGVQAATVMEEDFTGDSYPPSEPEYTFYENGASACFIEASGHNGQGLSGGAFEDICGFNNVAGFDFCDGSAQVEVWLRFPVQNAMTEGFYLGQPGGVGTTSVSNRNIPGFGLYVGTGEVTAAINPTSGPTVTASTGVNPNTTAWNRYVFSSGDCTGTKTFTLSVYAENGTLLGTASPSTGTGTDFSGFDSATFGYHGGTAPNSQIFMDELKFIGPLPPDLTTTWATNVNDVGHLYQAGEPNLVVLLQETTHQAGSFNAIGSESWSTLFWAEHPCFNDSAFLGANATGTLAIQPTNSLSMAPCDFTAPGTFSLADYGGGDAVGWGGRYSTGGLYELDEVGANPNNPFGCCLGPALRPIEYPRFSYGTSAAEGILRAEWMYLDRAVFLNTNQDTLYLINPSATSGDWSDVSILPDDNRLKTINRPNIDDLDSDPRGGGFGVTGPFGVTLYDANGAVILSNGTTPGNLLAIYQDRLYHSGDDGNLTAYNTSSGSLVPIWTHPDSAANDLAVSADGAYIIYPVSGATSTMNVLNTTDGTLVIDLASDEAVTAVTFSFDNKYAIAAHTTDTDRFNIAIVTDFFGDPNNLPPPDDENPYQPGGVPPVFSTTTTTTGQGAFNPPTSPVPVFGIDPESLGPDFGVDGNFLAFIFGAIIVLSSSAGGAIWLKQVPLMGAIIGAAIGLIAATSIGWIPLWAVLLLVLALLAVIVFVGRSRAE